VWASSGEWVQAPESVGDMNRRGESAGCLRMLPDDAERVWDWLAIGDAVVVIN
jgi:lipoprotein-anchoring transpeptidase ErfK/SrfK